LLYGDGEWGLGIGDLGFGTIPQSPLNFILNNNLIANINF